MVKILNVRNNHLTLTLCHWVLYLHKCWNILFCLQSYMIRKTFIFQSLCLYSQQIMFSFHHRSVSCWRGAFATDSVLHLSNSNQWSLEVCLRLCRVEEAIFQSVVSCSSVLYASPQIAPVLLFLFSR